MLIAFCAVGVILWVGGHDVFAGRLTAGELSAFVFYAFVVASARRRAVRGLGRAAARGRRDRAPDGAARYRSRASPRRRPRARCRRRRAARSTLRARDVRLSRAARRSPRSTASRSRSRRASAWRWSGPRARARRRCSQLLLRFYDPQAGARAHRRHRRARVRSAALRRRIARGAAGPGDLRRQRARERPLRPARGEPTTRCARACEAAYALEFIERLPQGFDTQLGERGVHALRRPAPAAVDRARAARRPADPAAGRGDELARRGERAHGAAGARSARARAHDARHRAPPRDRAARRPHRGDGPRPHRRRRARTPSSMRQGGLYAASRRCSSSAARKRRPRRRDARARRVRPRS